MSVYTAMMDQRLPRPAPLLPFSSTEPSDDKICQWYCCECGQSYGTVCLLIQSMEHSPTSHSLHNLHGFNTSNSPTLTSGPSTIAMIESGRVVPATRFNCLRCRHLMCPYCLKLRYGDLVAEKLLPKLESS